MSIFPYELFEMFYSSLVDGGFGTWGDWDECPVSCGGGWQTRSRACNNPAPSNGGSDCSGVTSHTQPCNVMDCPGRD